MDKRKWIKIGLQLSYWACLVLAVYIAYQMYQYRNGWDDAMRFYSETHLPIQPCFLINKSGV